MINKMKHMIKELLYKRPFIIHNLKTNDSYIILPIKENKHYKLMYDFKQKEYYCFTTL
jgi:hypothetical protein